MNSSITTDKVSADAKITKKRVFIDFKINAMDNTIENVCNMARIIGFKQVCINNPSKKLKEKIDIVSSQYNIKIHTRLDLGHQHENKQQLLSTVGRQRKNYPIISVHCETAELAAWAAQDNRVDILTFPNKLISRLLDNSLANLLLRYEKTVEIELAKVYLANSKEQIPIIRNIKKALTIALHKKIPIIFSSGSNEINQLRTPLQLYSLGQLLLGSDTPPLDSISTIPLSILKKNYQKISDEYIMPGVWKRPVFQEEEE